MVRSSLWTKTVALGMLIGASVIGNAAVSAAHSREDARADGARSALSAFQRAAPDAGARTVATLDRALADPDSYGGLDVGASPTPPAGDDADGGSATAGTGSDAQNDVGQVVPALYAWDPEVRFVFYRHVSKWM